MKINALVDMCECRCVALSYNTDIFKDLISAIIERDSDNNINPEKRFEVQEVELGPKKYMTMYNSPYVLTKMEKATGDGFFVNKVSVVKVSFDFNEVTQSRSNFKGKIKTSIVPILTSTEVSYIRKHPKDPLWGIRIKPMIDYSVRCIPKKMGFMKELALMSWSHLSLKDLQDPNNNLMVTIGCDNAIRHFSNMGVHLYDEDMEMFICRARSEEEAFDRMKSEMRSFISRFTHLYDSIISPFETLYYF